MVHHSQSLQGARLITVVRLQTLILAVSQPNGVDHERLTIPEPNGIAVPQRVRGVVGDMTAVIGVDATCFALLLVDPPCLARRDNELAQERLREPTWIARRQTVAQLVPFVAGLDLAKLFLECRAITGCQIRRGRAERTAESVAGLLGIELHSFGRIARPQSGPVR